MALDPEQEHMSPLRASTVVMIPFDGRFDGHGLSPKDVFDEQAAAGAPFGSTDNSPKSFSYDCFGFHPENSLIHVIDLSRCDNYGPADDRTFETFRNAELTPDEKELPRKQGNLRLIRKRIRLVAIFMPQGVHYEPISLVHDILVQTDSLGKMPEIPRGELVYRSSMPPWAREELISMHKLRLVPQGALGIPLAMPGGRSKGRKERFRRLSESMGKNIVDTHLSSFYTNSETSSTNIGQGRIVSGEDYVKMSHLGFGNPGIGLRATESYLNSGKDFVVETDLPDVRWGPMMAKLNPLAYWLPPNIVNYYDLFLFPPPSEIAMLKDSLKDMVTL